MRFSGEFHLGEKKRTHKGSVAARGFTFDQIRAIGEFAFKTPARKSAPH